MKVTVPSVCWRILAVFFSAVFLANLVTSQQEYPTFNEVPKGLSFTCQTRIPGYYADPEAQCQVWHWCTPTGAMYSFLCPNGTVFNQAVRVCDWWFNVDCPDAPNKYAINEDLYKDAQGNLIV
ncbi:hypothetical protein GE061_002423 [Apolygus lucorum]|uniref:Chitin-binding type-2 domain-containing protein n=1 Tax=Apolygus lucorum TaxID=248454 RepID=A0A8S9X544_APOLU|nr:hypothetical protein GE061_002423 [Apolygus lucorum]